VVDGIQESRIRDQIRREFARDLAAAKAAVEKAKAETAKAKSSRREFERKANDASYALRQQRERLAAARREIRRLSDALAAALDEPTPTPGAPTP
jgi:septal ring factor EnvC (AmiA/AmiB activator)